MGKVLSNIGKKTDAKLQILFIQQEFRKWSSSKRFSYTIHAFAFEEAFQSNNIDCFILTTPWLHWAKKFCNEMHFDQVWVCDITHLRVKETVFEWLSGIAPVRVGIVMESLEYSEDECVNYPHFKNRKLEVMNKFKYFTHVITCDEKDAIETNTNTQTHALWFPIAIPKRFISMIPNIKPEKPAVFSGGIYGLRIKFLENQNLKSLLVNQPAIEDTTLYPFLFNNLYRFTQIFKLTKLPGYKKIFPIYTKYLRLVRQTCFSLWLEGMKTGCAVVNLPSHFKGHAARVVEGMSAGCPMISCRVPERPQTESLFKNGEEILLYEKNDPDDLARQIKRIQSDSDLALSLVNNATQNLLNKHTMEKRVEQILKWINTGEMPNYT